MHCSLTKRCKPSKKLYSYKAVYKKSESMNMKYGPLNSVLERMSVRVMNEPVMESEERNKISNVKEDQLGNRQSNAIEGV